MILNRITHFTAFFLIPAMLGNSLAYAASKSLDAAAVKEKITARGVGHGVRVILTDKADIRGIIVSIGDQDFALKSEGVDQPQSIQYAVVTSVHAFKPSTKTKVAGASQGGLSKPAKVGIGVGIAVVGLMFVAIIVGAIVALKGAAHAG
jgi:hypothetical protein